MKREDMLAKNIQFAERRRAQLANKCALMAKTRAEAAAEAADREALRRLALAWGLSEDEASPSALYGAMTNAWTLAGALEALPERARLSLEALLSDRIPERPGRQRPDR